MEDAYVCFVLMADYFSGVDVAIANRRDSFVSVVRDVLNGA